MDQAPAFPAEREDGTHRPHPVVAAGSVTGSGICPMILPMRPVGTFMVDHQLRKGREWSLSGSGGGMDNEALLQEIAAYCRRARIAESTFGRMAVNDGKFVNRLRTGGRVTTDTVNRVRSFIAKHAEPAAKRPAVGKSNGPWPTPAEANADSAESQKNFRFFDNRQK